MALIPGPTNKKFIIFISDKSRMIEIVNLSSYVEFFAGLTVVFSGSKYFREEVTNTFIPSKIEENTNKQLKQTLSSLRNNLEKHKDLYGKIPLKKTKKIERLLQKAENYDLAVIPSLKFKLKITFIATFIYCLYLLLYIGLGKLVLTQFIWSESLQFFNCTLFTNLAIFLYILKTKQKAEIVGIRKYFIILIIIYGTSFVLKNWGLLLPESNTILVIVCTPALPFVLHILSEAYFIRSKKYYTKKLSDAITSFDLVLTEYLNQTPLFIPPLDQL
jgi:hypothetical protein